MKTEKKLGIWMDHRSAHLIDLEQNLIKPQNIDSNFTHEVREESLNRSEHIMHNKEQQQQSAYYQKLAKIILGYTDVILFGPTDAKLELRNLLCADHHFDNIKIETQQAGKMTEVQQIDFVKHHFSNHNSFQQN